MTRVFLVARRELAAFTGGSFGWVIIAFILAIDGVLFNAFAMKGEKTSSDVVRLFFHFSAIVTMTASILISMRALAAERELKLLIPR